MRKKKPKEFDSIRRAYNTGSIDYRYPRTIRFVRRQYFLGSIPRIRTFFYTLRTDFRLHRTTKFSHDFGRPQDGARIYVWLWAENSCRKIARKISVIKLTETNGLIVQPTDFGTVETVKEPVPGHKVRANHCGHDNKNTTIKSKLKCEKENRKRSIWERQTYVGERRWVLALARD